MGSFFFGSVRKSISSKSKAPRVAKLPRKSRIRREDSALSLAASGSKSFHYTFYVGKLASPSLHIVTRVQLY